jgi:hypothetical protein
MSATSAIHTLMLAATPATLGPRTRTIEEPGCRVCGLRPPPVYTEVEYVFDFWGGEDLIQALDTYAVSERLAEAMREAGIGGARLRDVRATPAPGFWLGDDAYRDSLPPFFRLEVTGTASGPERWYTSSVCPGCGRTNWERTDEGGRAMTAAISGEVGEPRRVYADSWSGDDLFVLDDPGPPLATGRFVELVAALGTPEVVFHPARWVERGDSGADAQPA